jgi:hypothetical protein
MWLPDLEVAVNQRQCPPLLILELKLPRKEGAADGSKLALAYVQVIVTPAGAAETL